MRRGCSDALAARIEPRTGSGRNRALPARDRPCRAPFAG